MRKLENKAKRSTKPIRVLTAKQLENAKGGLNSDAEAEVMNNPLFQGSGD